MLSGAQTIDIEVVLSGSSITVDINTVEAWSITDSDLSSNTKHGLVFVSKNNDAGTVDDFLVE